MYIKVNTAIMFVLLLMSDITKLNAQESDFTCKNRANEFLEKLIGTWEVNTKDRTSPGSYETNSGISVITSSIEGCGIKESFRGTFRGKPYGREVMIIGNDTSSIEMVALDSEHNSFSLLSGNIVESTLIVYWYRDPENKKLQSKYILTSENPEQFEFSSYLSTDYGDTWALTHERKYSRKVD